MQINGKIGIDENTAQQMSKFLLVLIFLLFSVSTSFSNEFEVLNPSQLPTELKLTYEKLVEAMKSGDAKNIRQFSLPFSVNVTNEARKDPSMESI